MATLIEQTNAYIRENSASSVWNQAVGSSPKGFNKPLFDLSYYLYSLNPDYQIESEKEAVDAQFIKEIFERAKSLRDLQVLTEKNFKEIKKLLNRLAHENGLSCRITRPKKLNAKYDEAKNEAYTFNNKLTDADWLYEIKKASNRRSKTKYKYSSLFISVVVGIGEGLVAAVLCGMKLAMAVPVIGIPAFLVNACLFYGAATTTMKDIFMGRIYYDENGNEVSSAMKKTIKSALSLSFVSGACFGILSYSSAAIALGKLCCGLTAAAALSATPVGLVIAAVFVAAVTTVALTCLYYRCTAGLLKNNTLGKIAGYFKNTFTNIYTYDCVKDGGNEWADWEALNKLEKFGFYATKTVAVAVNAIAVAAAIGVSFIFTVASFGMFANKAATLVALSFKAGEATAKLASKIIVGVGSVLNTVFQVNSVNTFCTIATKAIATVALLPFAVIGFAIQFAMDRKKTWNKVKQSYQRTFSKENRANLLAKSCRFIFRMVLTGCAIINGIAQGLGGDNDTSIIAVSKATDHVISSNTAKGASVGALTAASNGANLVAVEEVTAGESTGIRPERSRRDRIDTLEKTYQDITIDSTDEYKKLSPDQQETLSNKIKDAMVAKARKAKISTTFFEVLEKHGGQLTDQQKNLYCTANAFANIDNTKTPAAESPQRASLSTCESSSINSEPATPVADFEAVEETIAETFDKSVSVLVA